MITFAWYFKAGSFIDKKIKPIKTKIHGRKPFLQSNMD